MASITKRLRHAWNVFSELENPRPEGFNSGGSSAAYGHRPDRTRLRFSNERSIISSIYTRIGIDAASVELRHVRLDEQGRYLSDMDSGLNNCLTLEANVDQAARAFRQDMVMSLCDKGVIAIVPIDTSAAPTAMGSYDILTMRVGEVVAWYPNDVRVSVYNQDKGKREELTLSKKSVAIVENPLYSVMNEPNSTLQRLLRKLNLLDVVDEQSASGKLDLIIQLPYVIKSEARRQVAEQRRADIELQLRGSQYGIAYTDGTEKITQLNRPAENNLMKQIEFLTTMLYGQLGLTEEVMNGTADEKAMLNYQNRTIEPIIAAIQEGLLRRFLTKTARSQNQSVEYFKDPFKLVPINDIAEIADKFTRNEIVSSNEMRQIIGMKPSADPKADLLINSNMPNNNPTAQPGDSTTSPDSTDQTDESMSIMNDAFDEMDSSLDSIFNDLGVDENAVS